MKLDYVMLACDDHEYYYPYWKVIAKAWEKLDVCPVLYYVGDDKTLLRRLRLEHSNVVHFSPLEWIPSGFQAQCIRMLASNLDLYQEHVVTMSDMDMLPLSYRYFQGSIQDLDDNVFVVYRPFHKIRGEEGKGYDEWLIPFCYNASKGSVWRDIFHVTNELQIRDSLVKWYQLIEKIPEQIAFLADQMLLHQYVKQCWPLAATHCVELGDDVTNFSRTSRLEHIDMLQSADVKQIMSFCDFHLPRPYMDYQALLDPVFAQLNVL